MADLDQATIEHLKAKHGDDLTLIEAEGVSIVTKPVGIGPYRIFRKKAADDATRATAEEGLFFDVLVYPERQQLMAQIEGKPFLLVHFTSEVIKTAGAMAEVRSKKL